VAYLLQCVWYPIRIENSTIYEKINFVFLLSSIYAQEQVFNVQRYCVDEKPFKQGECNISGNEYFCTLDIQKTRGSFLLTLLK
jgi:hypothetical protein